MMFSFTKVVKFVANTEIMRIQILALCILWGLMSCSSPEQKLQAEISEMETELDDTASGELAASLMGKYQTYVDTYSESNPDMSARYVYRQAGVYFRSGDMAKVMERISTIETKFPGSSVEAETMLFKANMYEETYGQPDKAKPIYEAFLEKFPNHERKAEAEFFFMPEDVKLKQRIADLEDELFGENAVPRPDVRQMNTLVGYYEKLGTDYPNFEDAAANLYKGGEVAQSAKNFFKAIELFDKVYTQYPAYEKAPQALFLQGFIYENDYRDLDKAKEKYKAFMKAHPQHELAKDVQFSLDNLGKTAEEILQMFEEKNAN